MTEFAIQQEAAVGLIRFHLSGFRGFPNSEAAMNVFARCIQECCVSIEHAQAVLKLFLEEFPTLKEIITTATNLRDQFEPAEDPRKEWERKYGKPSPVELNFTPTKEPEFIERDRKIKKYITEKHGGNFPGFAKIDWTELFAALSRLNSGK